MHRARRRNLRFTLIELLTVMAIIFVLAAMIVGVSAVVSRNMAEAKTKAKLEAAMLALQEYQQDRGYFPPLSGADSGWVDLSLVLDDFRNTQTGRPYLEGYAGGVYKDGWEKPFQYTTDAATALGGTPPASETGYWLRSNGHDKAGGTEDDICSWKQH